LTISAAIRRASSFAFPDGSTHMDEHSLKMNADACEKLANASTDHVAKGTFHDLAHLWRELARRVERLDRERPDNDQDQKGNVSGF
jgi:hypothetical protein